MLELLLLNADCFCIHIIHSIYLHLLFISRVTTYDNIHKYLACHEGNNISSDRSFLRSIDMRGYEYSMTVNSLNLLFSTVD